MALRACASNRAQIYFAGCGYIIRAWSISEGKLGTPYRMAGVDHYCLPLYPFFIYLLLIFIAPWTLATKTVSFSGILNLLRLNNAKTGMYLK